MTYDQFEECQLDTFGFQSKNTVKVFESTELSDDALLENIYNCLAISYSKLKLFATYNRQLSVLSLPTLSKSIENPALGKNEILSDQHEVLLDIDYDAIQIHLNFNSTILYLLTADGKIVSCDVESLLKGKLVTKVLDFTDQILRFCPSTESNSVLILTKSNKLLLLKDEIEPLLDNICSVNWYGLTDSEIIYSHLASKDAIIANVNDISNHIKIINLELDEECPEIIDFKVFGDDKFVIFTCDQLESPNSQIVYVVNNKVIHKTDNIFNMFSMVDRLSSFYSQLLPKWSETYPELLVGLSSKSEEISILTPDFQLDLLNDQDMATLPLFDDNDTSAIGFAIDITSTEKVVEPCKGIEESEALPRVYILNNYGQLVSWNIWSSVDIRNNKVSLDNCLAALKYHQPNNTESIQPISDHQSTIDKAEDVTIPLSEIKDNAAGFESSQSLNNVQSQSRPSLGDQNLPSENESAKTATSFTFKVSNADSNKDKATPFGSTSLTAGSNGFGSTGFGSTGFGSTGFGSTGFGKTGFNSSAFNSGSSPSSVNTSKAKPFASSQGGFGSFAGHTNAFSNISTGSNSLFSSETKSSIDDNASPFGQLSDSKISIFGEASTQKSSLVGQSQATSIFGGSNVTNDNPFSQPQQNSIFTNEADRSSADKQKTLPLFGNAKSNTTGLFDKQEPANSSSYKAPENTLALFDSQKKRDPLDSFGHHFGDALSVPKGESVSFKNASNASEIVEPKLEATNMKGDEKTIQPDFGVHNKISEEEYISHKFSSEQEVEEPSSEDELSDSKTSREKTLNESISRETLLDTITSRHGNSSGKIEQEEEKSSLQSKEANRSVAADRDSWEADCDNKSDSKLDHKTTEVNLNDSDFELVTRPDPTKDPYLLSDEESVKEEKASSEEESSVQKVLPREEELSNQEESPNDDIESEKIRQSRDISYIQSKYSGVKNELHQNETQSKHNKINKTPIELTTTTLYVNESVDVTTATVNYVNESTEFSPVYINDDTDFGIAEDHTILTFEGEETYLSKFYIPKQLPLLTARGNITYPENIDVYPTIGREIIKLIYDIETEFLVLNENAQNLTDYLQDQNSNKIIQHTLKNSSLFPSHWRFCESETVARGIQDTAADYMNIISDTNELFDKANTMHQDVFLFAKKLVSIGIELKDIEDEFKVAEENSSTPSRSLSLENIKKRELLKKKALSLKVTYERLSQCVLILNSQLHPEKIVSPQFESILSSIQKAIHHNMDNIQDLKIELKKFTDAGKSDSTGISSTPTFSIVLDEEYVKLQMERILAREARKKMVIKLIKQNPFTIKKNL